MTSTHVGTGRPGGVSFDPFATVTGLVTLRDAALRGDWPGLRGLLEGCATADAQTLAVGTLAELPGVERLLEQAVAAEPGDALARTLLAARYVDIGWGIRSRAQASAVTRDQAEQFHAWLRTAERILIEVCAERPDLAAAWTTRLMTARGLELGLAEARRRYQRLAVHHPHHLAAQEQLLQMLCPKWGGTWDDALAFARESAAAAPPGYPSGALVATVHVERWIDDDDGRPRLTAREVRDELCAVAMRSLWHPGADLGVHEVGAHSAFALAFSLGGHAREAAPHFRVLGDRATLHLWRYLNNPAGSYAKFRRAALDAEAKGGAR